MPDEVTKMLAGLMSRWMMPLETVWFRVQSSRFMVQIELASENLEP